MESTSRGRITIDPSVMGGQPCVRGMRMPVSTVIMLIEDGITDAEILVEHPDLEPDDLAACIEYAGRDAEVDVLSPWRRPLGPDE